jgi:hypothetical protein
MLKTFKNTEKININVIYKKCMVQDSSLAADSYSADEGFSYYGTQRNITVYTKDITEPYFQDKGSLHTTIKKKAFNKCTLTETKIGRLVYSNSPSGSTVIRILRFFCSFISFISAFSQI